MWIKSYPIIEYYMKTKQNWSWTQHNWSWEHKFQAATRTSHFINIAWESQTALLFQHRWNLISILKPKLKGLYNQYKRIWSISYISHPQVNINSCCTFDGIDQVKVRKFSRTRVVWIVCLFLVSSSDKTGWTTVRSWIEPPGHYLWIQLNHGNKHFSLLLVISNPPNPKIRNLCFLSLYKE